MYTKPMTLSVLLVVMLVLFAANSVTTSATEAQASNLTVEVNGLPVDLWDTPLGSEGSLTFDLPTDISSYTEAILFLHADDIDAQPETGL